jgi:hypothetical protein
LKFALLAVSTALINRHWTRCEECGTERRNKAEQQEKQRKAEIDKEWRKKTMKYTTKDEKLVSICQSRKSDKRKRKG